MRLLALAVLLTAQTASADGRIIETTRKVGDFNGVQVGSGIVARVETGPAGAIVLKGDEAALGHVKTEIKDSVLIISLDEDHGSSREAITVSVKLPRARSLGVSGGSRMEASVPAADHFEVNASGGGELRVTSKVSTKRFELGASGGSRVTLAGVDAAEMDFSLSGASRATLSGRAERAQADLSGAAELSGAELQVADLRVDGTGGIKLVMRAQKTVSGSLGGGSRIRIPGGTALSVSVSGGSKVSQDL